MSGSQEKCIIFVKCINGIDDFQFDVPMDSSITNVKQQVRDRLPPSVVPRASISSMGGLDINPYKNVHDLYYSVTSNQASDFTKFLNLKINICLCGGKGGFGQLLKAQAHSMSKKKNRKNLKSNSKDYFKTLDGRRVKTIKKIKQLDEYMSTLDEHEKTKIAEKKAKLQKILDVDLNKNFKFEDTKFLDDVEKQLEEMRESVNYVESSSSDDEISSDDESDGGSSQSVQEGSSASSSSSTKNRRSKFTSFFDEDEDDDEIEDEQSTKSLPNSKGKEIEV